MDLISYADWQDLSYPHYLPACPSCGVLHAKLAQRPELTHPAQGNLTLKPVLKLEGAQLDGGDLLMHANVTEDRRSLVALTPESQTPLNAGDHPLKLSLNGQFTEEEQGDIVRPHAFTFRGTTCCSVLLMSKAMLAVTS